MTNPGDGLDRARLGELFEEALALPPGARDAFLDRACADNPPLLRELQSLLEAHARAPGRLEQMAGEVVPAALEAIGSMVWPIGRTVSHYRIESLIGAGGMGVVYKARDLALGRVVALKFLRPHLTGDPASRRRLEAEAKAASALDHPNIATVYEIGSVDAPAGDREAGRLFIAMGYYAGETIREKIARGPLPVGDALDYACQVADGLARAHEAGIVHRDIKPANLIVTDRGEVKIVDFGLAKSTESEPTREGATRGTVAYMSPEQTRGGSVDHRTDIWSLGAVLYEMLAGRRPFSSDHDRLLIQAIRHDEPEPLEHARPEVSAPVAAIVGSCLEKGPDARCPGAKELGARLRAVAERPATDRPRPAHASTHARPVRAARAVRTRRLRLVSGLIGLTAAVLLFAWRAGNTDGDAAALDSTGPRLAVLPFVNLRADPATDFLGYALADEISGRIGYLDGLTVRPASAVRRYQGQIIDPRDVARALRVDYLLTGSYLREGDTLRVNIELMNADSGISEWREPIELAYDSVFRLQDLVTQRVAERLRLTWTLEARERAARDVASDPTAYHLYLRALGYPLGTEEGNRYAYELLSRSVDRDPTYAPAVAALAYRAYMLGIMGFTDSRTAVLEEAERLYERALRLNPDHVPGLATQALLFLETGRIEEALEPLRRALTIQPDAADAYLSLAYVYRKAGLLREAGRLFEHGSSLDHTSLRLAPGGLIYLYVGEYDEALEQFALDANAAPSLVWQGMALLHQGHPAVARERFEEAVRRSPESPLGLIARAHVAYLDDDLQEALEVVRTLEGRARAGGVHGEELYHVARLFCLFGDAVTGNRMLQQAVDHGFFPYPFLLVDPFLDSVRHDAGFQRVMARARERHESFRALVSGTELPQQLQARSSAR